MDCPFTITKQDGTIIQLKWRIKKEVKLIEQKSLDNKPLSTQKPKKKLVKKDYIKKCLNKIKKKLNIITMCDFTFYSFKEIKLLSIKKHISCWQACDLRCECKKKNVTFYTLNLNKMTPTIKSPNQTNLSEKSISQLKNIISSIEMNQLFLI